MHLDIGEVLRDVIRRKSRLDVASALIARLASSRSVVLARVWLASDSGPLELAASGGNPSGGGSYNRLDGEFREMAVADATIAEIGDARAPLVVRGLRGDEAWLTNPSWAARQGVRAFIGLPLIGEDRLEGALAIFDREMPPDEVIAELQLAADITALRIEELGARLAPAVAPSAVSDTPTAKTFITRAELRQLEKASIASALAQTQGKVFGADGAAALLGMRPTTLASRIKALGLSR